MKLTELEKTILFVFLVSSKGSREKYLEEDLVLSKFTRRQRILVKRFLKRLEKDKLIIRKEKNYKLSKKGLRIALNLLHEGVKLWKVQ